MSFWHFYSGESIYEKEKRWFMRKRKFSVRGSAAANRSWLVYLAGSRDSPLQLKDAFQRNEPAVDVAHALKFGARIPRSLRRYIKHQSWSIDPNYVKLRKLVREGRRIADTWERQRETVKIWVEKDKPCPEP